jgi:tetratricopeptide (TPR) repeat protein
MQALFWLIQVEIAFGNLETAIALLDELEPLIKASPDEYLWHWAKGVYLGQTQQLEAARHHLQEALRLSVNEFDGEHQWIQLELYRVNNDLHAARTGLETCRKMGFMAGVTLALRYFPQLAEAPIAPAPVAPSLWVHALGRMQITLDGVTIPLRGAKRKHLVALLLEAQLGGRSECKHNELIDALYPNSSEEDAREAVKQLVFQWRNQYGPSSIVTTDYGYAFGAVGSDAQQFLETGEVALWRGAYLEDVEDWSARAFDTVREALYTNLKAWTLESVSTNPTEAVRLANIALEADPFDPDALSLTIRALQAQGSYNSISKLYQRSKATWLEVGERLPELWTEFLESA